MGLDMYLSKRTYVKNYDFRKDKVYKVKPTLNKKAVSHIKPDRISYVIEEVGYWRKANHIHNWFVQTVQEGEDNCKEYEVELEQLIELKDLCQKANELVLSSPTKSVEVFKTFSGEDIIDTNYSVDEKKMSEILPTASGFFFGGTEYDNYYIEINNYTIELINSILEEVEEAKKTNCWLSYYYSSSW